MPKRKTRKKKTTKNTKSKAKVEDKVNEETIEIPNPSSTSDQENLSDEQPIIETNTEIINNSDVAPTILELQNENAELKATIEKAKKKLRILKMKLDLSEEKEEQWRIACYNIADIFAEKSQVSLEDVLKKFEAPIDDEIAI